MHENAFVCKLLPYIILLTDPYLKFIHPELCSSYCLRHPDPPRTKYCNFVPKSKHPIPGKYMIMRIYVTELIIR